MNILDEITPLERVSTNRADEIVRKFEALIFRSKLQAGTCLGTKENLRHRFKVSPATMNEATRILASRGVITLRRGANGGVFVAGIFPQVTLAQSLLEIDGGAASIEDCWAVLMQLKPLLIIGATEKVTDNGVTELNHLVDKMSETSADQPLDSLRWSWRVYQKLVEMGSNTVLKTLCTILLNFLESRLDQLAAIYSAPNHFAAIRRDVEAVASGKSERANSGIHRGSFSFIN